uniref:Uncharacterized protein n=1 Tax=Arundo donax TaxID=35708 RepID=A0A0A9D707_ARUDO
MLSKLIPHASTTVSTANVICTNPSVIYMNHMPKWCSSISLSLISIRTKFPAGQINFDSQYHSQLLSWILVLLRVKLRSYAFQLPGF